PAVVITGGIHAREWIAPAMAYLIAEYLVRNYNTAPATRFEQALKKLIDTRRIFIVPLLNPQGNSYTVYNPAPNARMWRKNRRDLPMTSPGWVAVLNTAGVPNPPFQNVVAGPAPAFATYDVPVYQRAATNTVTIASAQPLVGVDLNRNCATNAWGHHTTGSTEGDPTQEDYF